MVIFQKIDFKKFLPVTLFVNLVFIFFLKIPQEILSFIVIYFAGLINIALLYQVIYKIVEVTKNNQKKIKKWKIALLFLLKLLILIGAITWGVQTMQKRIIIPIFNYVIHIFVVLLTLKKVSQ